uniref:TSA: Wollemia nobilis Ref_Wollemi_Transcript_2109_1246 transcribed RNA sequence n=1 Tax=Wollemia nobilis TaxID=56998 RepID=A0A0C9RYV9_9CONI
MDADFRSFYLKRQQAIELAAHSDRLISLQGLEEENESARRDLACPFCYKALDVDALCHHVQDEHRLHSNSKRVCPICGAKSGNDVLGHITLQHGRLFKARRRSHNGEIPSNSISFYLGKELQEERRHSFRREAFGSVGSNSSTATLDPLLSGFVHNMLSYETKKLPGPRLSSEESLTRNSTSNVEFATSVKSSPTLQEREQKFEEMSGRVEFVQQLVLSTILGDEL